MTYRTPEDALERLDRDIAAAQERAERARTFRESVDRLRASATVDGVTATVDVTGVLTDLSLPGQLSYRDPGRLSRTVLEAVRAAHAQVAEAAKDAAAREFGAGSATALAFGAELDRRFSPRGGTR